MAEKDPTGVSSVFARNVRLRRISGGMSQTELAKRMKANGFAFHQQTVQRIEDGERPVKLDEAIAISELFGVDVRMMSLDRARLRMREISEAVTGSLELIDGMFRGAEGWLNKCQDLYWQLSDDVDQSTINVRRLQAGRHILATVVAQAQIAEARARELQQAYFEAAYELLWPGELDLDPDEEDDRPEGVARRDPGIKEYLAFLDTIEPDPAYERFSVAELMEIYISPDNDRARELLGADFGPEPTEDSDASDMFMRDRSSRA